MTDAIEYYDLMLKLLCAYLAVFEIGLSVGAIVVINRARAAPRATAAARC